MDSYPVIIEFHSVRIDIINVDDIKIEETIIFVNHQNTTLTSFDLCINQSFKDLQVEYLHQHIIPFYSNVTKIASIPLNPGLRTNERGDLFIEYFLDFELPQAVENRKIFYHLQCKKTSIYFTDKFEVLLRLPQNSFPHESKEYDYSITPTNYTYGEPTENRIAIFWSFSNMTPQTDILFEIFFDEPGREKPPVWVFVVGPVCSLACGVGITYWLSRRRTKKIVRDVGTIFLTDDHKLLLKLISDKGGKISQKELVKSTGFTNSKISRNLRTLEENQLIEKEKWGREYRIYLTETGQKVIK
jgi:DNA-binding HxlR family transcriptional regulator